MGLGLLFAKEFGRELGREAVHLAGNLLLRPASEKEEEVSCPVAVELNYSALREVCARDPPARELSWLLIVVFFLCLLVTFLVGVLVGGRWCPHNGRKKARRRGSGVVVHED